MNPEDEQDQQSDQSPSRSGEAMRNALRARQGLRENPRLRQGGKLINKAAKKTGSRIVRRAAARVIIFLGTNPEILIPLLIFVIIALVFILILFPTPENVDAVEPIQCASIPGASCQASAASCPALTTADTTDTYTCSATGATTTQVCCVPRKTFAVPDCSTIDQKLRSDFGVVIREIGETMSCAKRQEIYRIYSTPFQSASYAKYLKPATPFTLQLYAPDRSGCGSHAYTPSGYAINFYGLSKAMDCLSQRITGFYILHETGHVISNRNYSIFSQQFPYRSLTQSDPSCFISCTYGPQPKTYSLCWNNLPHETFAEFNSLYIYNSKVGANGTISNFRSQCDASWRYYNSTLFGGTIIAP